MGGGAIEIELIILAAIYAGAGVAMVRAILLRREALAAWRRDAGGVFDHRVQRLANELEIDRAPKLPPEAKRKLFQSRRVLAVGFGALLLAIVLNVVVLRGAA